MSTSRLGRGFLGTHRCVVLCEEETSSLDHASFAKMCVCACECGRFFVRDGRASFDDQISLRPSSLARNHPCFGSRNHGTRRGMVPCIGRCSCRSLVRNLQGKEWCVDSSGSELVESTPCRRTSALLGPCLQPPLSCLLRLRTRSLSLSRSLLLSILERSAHTPACMVVCVLDSAVHLETTTRRRWWSFFSNERPQATRRRRHAKTFPSSSPVPV